MKYTLLTLATLLAWATAMPQEQLPSISTSVTVVTVIGQQPAPTEPIPNIPAPIPTPTEPIPNIPSAPPPAPGASDPAQPAPPSGGSNCVCGATYCGKVLVGFQGYNSEQLGQGYCSTPGTDCAAGPPSVDSLDDTLFVCICPPGQEKGSTIELICPCQGRCKNDEPDFIGRCEKPCNLGCAPAAPAASVSPVPIPVPIEEPLPAPVDAQPVQAPPRARRH